MRRRTAAIRSTDRMCGDRPGNVTAVGFAGPGSSEPGRAQDLGELLVELQLLAGAGEVDDPGSIEHIEPISSKLRLQDATDIRFEQEQRGWSIAGQVPKVVPEQRLVSLNHLITHGARERIHRLVGRVHQHPSVSLEFPYLWLQNTL